MIFVMDTCLFSLSQERQGLNMLNITYVDDVWWYGILIGLIVPNFARPVYGPNSNRTIEDFSGRLMPDTVKKDIKSPDSY